MLSLCISMPFRTFFLWGIFCPRHTFVKIRFRTQPIRILVRSQPSITIKSFALFWFYVHLYLFLIYQESTRCLNVWVFPQHYIRIGNVPIFYTWHNLSLTHYHWKSTDFLTRNPSNAWHFLFMPHYHWKSTYFISN